MTTSVIIPFLASKTPSHLGKTLQALAAQTILPGEIILINYGKEQPDPAFLEGNIFSKMPGLKLLDCFGKNLNQARNFGVEHASGWLIVFLNEWLVADPKLVETYLTEYKKSPLTPFASAGIVEWSVELEPTPLRNFLSAASGSYHYSYDKIKNFNAAGYQYFNATNLAVVRQVLLEEKEQTGFIFDTAFDSVLGDRELGYRLQKKGISLRFVPAAGAWSSERSGLAEATTYQFQKGKAALLFSGKHLELGADEIDPNLIAAPERFQRLTRTALANLSDRIERLEKINRIGAKDILIQGKPFDLLLNQVLEGLYNSLLTAFFDLGVGMAYGQATGETAETKKIELETGLESLIKTSGDAPFSLELKLNFQPSIKVEDQLIDRLSLVIHEQKLEIDRLKQLTEPTPDYYRAIADGYLDSLNNYKILANEYLENVNHFRLLADQRKIELDQSKAELEQLRNVLERHRAESTLQTEQLQNQQAEINFYHQEFNSAENYALHVETEYKKLVEATTTSGSGTASEIPGENNGLKKIAVLLRDSLPRFTKR